MGLLIFNPLILFQEVEAARHSMLRKIYYLTDEVLVLPLSLIFIHCEVFIDCTNSSSYISDNLSLINHSVSHLVDHHPTVIVLGYFLPFMVILAWRGFFLF